MRARAHEATPEPARERRDLVLVVLAAALLYLPWLGATGLWDPWETHYAEVARQMLARHDWVYPWWEGAPFFSKPVLSFWMMALGMKLAGIDPLAAGPLPAGTEWAVRLPFALLAILGVAFVYLAVSRIASRRAGLLSAATVGTSPLWLLLARQAVTDMPFVSTLTAALSCLAIAELADDPRSRAHRDLWLWASYAFCALSTLAKGLLGFLLPGAIALAFMGLTADGQLPRRVRLASGSAIFLALAAPWYVALSLFHGKDEEGLTFVQRFFVHDHFARLAEGVHTTTPGGTFTYFIEQLGFGIFPWVVLVPGALWLVLKMRPTRGERQGRMTAFLLAWALVPFLLFSLSETKFHHYAFPVLPPLCILGGLYLDRLLEEPLEDHLVPLTLGLSFLVLVAQNLIEAPSHLVNLFIYNYDRPYPEKELFAAAPALSLGSAFRFSLAPRAALSGISFALAASLAAGWLSKSRRAVAASLLGGAAALALWISWLHWEELSPHWSQRALFATYYRERKGLEPIGAYFLNWRGETFYSRNQVVQLLDFTAVHGFLARPGREFIIIEPPRYEDFKRIIGADYTPTILDSSSNKYWLVAVDGGKAPGTGTGEKPALTSPPD